VGVRAEKKKGGGTDRSFPKIAPTDLYSPSMKNTAEAKKGEGRFRSEHKRKEPRGLSPPKEDKKNGKSIGELSLWTGGMVIQGRWGRAPK